MVNFLARHSATPTKRHWVGIKTILRYLNRTRDLGLFYSRSQDTILLGYTHAGYLSDPHSGTSQIGFFARFNNNILKVFKANFGVYFHQSFCNCYIRSIM